MRRTLARVLLLASVAALSACGRPERSSPADRAAKESASELNIYIWSAYLPKSIPDEFTRRTGIPVHYDTYDSNEALLDKLQSGVADYDLVVPSNYMVRILASLKLIQPLDRSRLHTLQNFDPRFLDKSFDPQNRYSLPYTWGTTGLAYNKQKISGAVDSWDVLFDPKHKGRILMLDDMRECFAVALKKMGRSLNEKDPAILKQAADLLKKQKALVKTFDSGDFENILAAGDVDLAHGFSGQLAKVVAKNPEKFAFVIPKEGCSIWMDNVCIPSRARHADAVYKFLDFIQDPEINARIVNAISYASANVPAKKFINPAILADPAVYTPESMLGKAEFIEDLGETTTLMDQYWTEIKAQ